MANEVIGNVRCPWCSSDKARVSVTKSGLCAVTCSACHSQTFARSDYSDTKIRQAMTPVRQQPAPPVAADPIIVPGVVVEANEAKKEEPAPPVVEKKKASAWDIWGEK